MGALFRFIPWAEVEIIDDEEVSCLGFREGSRVREDGRMGIEVGSGGGGGAGHSLYLPLVSIPEK